MQPSSPGLRRSASISQHHNPFASLRTPSSDPLGFGGTSSPFFASAGVGVASDPWSTPVNSYDNSSYASPVSPRAALAGPLAGLSLDEQHIPYVYVRAWNAASSSSASTAQAQGYAGSGFVGPFSGQERHSNTPAAQSVSLATLQKVLGQCASLSAGETERIVNLVSAASIDLSASFTGVPAVASPVRTGNATGRIERVQFFAALALAALAQQKQTLSLEAVSARVKTGDLPIPTLDLSKMQNGPSSSFADYRPIPTRQPSSPSTPYRNHKLSLGSNSSDPWNTGGRHDPSPAADLTQSAPDFGASTSSSSSKMNGPPMYSPPRPRNHISDNGYSSFPSFNEEDSLENGQHERDYSTGQSDHTARGGSGSAGESSSSALLSLPPYHSAIAFTNALDRITIQQQTELAGNFLTRHTVYRVFSERRKTSVLRRYSDWIWLNEYLEKRYPARLRLSLPPKRMGISARHVQIASDEQFLERRRRGLMRYLEVAANHPVVKNDRVLNVFLSETVDLAIWKKQHLSDVDTVEEGSALKLTSSQESLIPTTFDAMLMTLKEALPGIVDALSRFCSLLERINHRNLQNAADAVRARLALDSFGETYAGLSTSGPHGGQPREVEEEAAVIVRDIRRLAGGMGELAELEEADALASESATLERDLKAQREVWRALGALVDQYTTGSLNPSKDAVEKTRKKVEVAQAKHATLSRVPLEARKANHGEEMNKIVAGIESDQLAIERALDRRAYIRWALTAEIRYTWRFSTALRVGMSEWTGRSNQHHQRLGQICAALDDALSIA